MASDANGVLVVPVWSDGGTVKPVVNDDGRIDVTIGAALVTQDVNIKSSDIDVPVSVDAQGITLDINLKSSDITLNVEEQSPLTTIETKAHGYVGGAWQNQPMIFGYTDTVRVTATNTSTGTGIINATCTAVPSGYVHVITGFLTNHNDAAARDVSIGVWTGSAQYCGYVVTQAVSAQNYGDTVHIVLKVGESLLARCYMSVAGKTLNVWGIGYSMKVND